MPYFMTDVKNVKPKPPYRLREDWCLWLCVGLAIGVLIGGLS